MHIARSDLNFFVDPNSHAFDERLMIDPIYGIGGIRSDDAVEKTSRIIYSL